jgi:hypothetical protein
VFTFHPVKIHLPIRKLLVTCISVVAQIALYLVQEQGESAEFTGVNEHFPDSDWTE